MKAYTAAFLLLPFWGAAALLVHIGLRLTGRRRKGSLSLLRGLVEFEPTLCKGRVEEPDGTGAYAVQGEQLLA